MQAECRKCHKVFKMLSKRHTYCSEKCSDVAYARRKAGSAEADTIVTCPYCNQTVVSKRTNSKTCGKTACVKIHKKHLKAQHRALCKEDGRSKDWRNAWNAKQPKKQQHPMGPQWNNARWAAHVQRIRLKELRRNLYWLKLAISKIKNDAKVTYGFSCSRCGNHIPPGANIKKPFWDWCKDCIRKAAKKDMKKNGNKRARERHKRLRATDPVWTMRTRIMGRMHKAFKRCGLNVIKGKTLAPYLGCTYRQATEYIEQQFKPRMTWKNYGTAWHVDHAIPLAAHDLSTEEGRRKAFHYTNLQPMWAKENIRKSDTLPANGHQPRLLLTNRGEDTPNEYRIISRASGVVKPKQTE